MTQPDALDEAEATSSQVTEPYLIGVAVGAGVAMTLLWVLREASPVTALVPPAALLVAFLVATVRRDADARRQIGILLFFVVIGVLLGGVVVLPMPYADAGAGWSLATLSPLLGAVAVVTVARLVRR